MSDTFVLIAILIVMTLGTEFYFRSKEDSRRAERHEACLQTEKARKEAAEAIRDEHTWEIDSD
ncbi:hypothetical protein [Enterococcus gallinarum]|uniref:hypothetical protein n=1 Tax=Enterococcus gallinarum TaxID=1353 RepID=UPI0024338315|nr:hypothetical protein [Enterococcus gallinarum]